MKLPFMTLIFVSLLSGCASEPNSSIKQTPSGTAITLPPPTAPDLNSQQNNAQTTVGKMLSY